MISPDNLVFALQDSDKIQTSFEYLHIPSVVKHICQSLY